MSKVAYILIGCLAVGALLPAGAGAAPRQQVDPRLIPGSRVRQLMLKQALDKHVSGTLVAELNQNKRLWASMSPEQVRRLREIYVGFLQLAEDEQIKRLSAMPEFEKLSAAQRKLYRERAAWLTRVVASLTPAQREALKKMTPTERARRLLELKKALPTTGPTTRPGAGVVSQPSAE